MKPQDKRVIFFCCVHSDFKNYLYIKIFFTLLTMLNEAFDCVDHNKLREILKEM